MKDLKIKIKLNKNKAIGVLSIMLAATLWSIDGVFIRSKFYSLPVGLVVFLEHFLGFLFLFPFIIINWTKVKLLSKKDWKAILWVCVFGGLIGTIMITKAFFTAFHGEITFATVIILQKLQPIFALILARIILKEKLNRRFYIWASLAIVAAYFLSFGKTGLNINSIDLFHHAAFFSILAAFAFGSSTVFGKRIINHLDFETTTALRFGITSILAFLFILVTGDLLKINQVSFLQWKFLFLIVFSSGAVAMYIYYFGLKKITASMTTISELFFPISAIMLDYFINKNFLNNIQIIATIVLLFSFYMIVKYGKIKTIEFQAKIISGLGNGKKLGFPTLNLDQTNLDINHGVYLVEAIINHKKYSALLHFGCKETFQQTASMELFIKEEIINIKKEEKINIKIIKKIREIKKFDNKDNLKKQVISEIKKYL